MWILVNKCSLPAKKWGDSFPLGLAHFRLTHRNSSLAQPVNEVIVPCRVVALQVVVLNVQSNSESLTVS